MSPRARHSATARHHVEWLQLVDVSGPFLSLSVLVEAFPQGLDADDPEVAERLRRAVSEWQANEELRRPDPAIHREFLRLQLVLHARHEDEVVTRGQAAEPVPCYSTLRTGRESHASSQARSVARMRGECPQSSASTGTA